MTDPISTEGRIFARQLAREAHRRELIGAKVLGGKDNWTDASLQAMQMIRDAKGPVRAMNVVRKLIDRLTDVPIDDRSYMFPPGTYFMSKRQAIVTLFTLEYGKHPIVQETGILVRRHLYHTARKSVAGRVCDEMVFISDHTLGRLHERSTDGVWYNPMRVFGLAGLLAMAGEIGFYMARLHENKPGSQINIPIEDTILTGSMRHINKVDAAGPYFQPFFDVRTMLPEGRELPNQRKQATIIWQIIKRAIDENAPLAAVLGREPELLRS